MGVSSDYFRARDDDDAERVAAIHEGRALSNDRGEPAFDWVDGCGVDAAVTLGRLVAMLRGVEWTDDLCGDEARDIWTEPGEEGPWIAELPNHVRDTLADVELASIPRWASRWAQTVTFHGVDGPALEPLLTELVALARRARLAGHHVYNWVSL